MKIFVCFTPLHVLIAQRIIEIEHIKEYIFIYFTDLDTQKNRFYYEKLYKNSNYSSYTILTKNIFKDLIIVYGLYRKINPYIKGCFLRYYTGKIKSSHVRLLMYLTKFKQLITFDDGSGNVSGSGYFYDDKENILFKLFFLGFNRRLVYSNIKGDIYKHYTIFDLPNVFQNKFLINLFESDNLSQNKRGKEKFTILLTNAFSEDGEMKLEDEKELYKKIIDQFKITHISKHPREKFSKIEDSSIIVLKSKQISEELIFDLSEKYKLTVVAIYSTTLLNLIAIKDIELINVHAELKKPTAIFKKLLKDENIETKYLQ